MSKNDITGDDIKSKVSTKEYEDNWERIFRKTKVVRIGTSPNKLAECPSYPEPCFCTGACKGSVSKYDAYTQVERDYNEGN